MSSTAHKSHSDAYSALCKALDSLLLHHNILKISNLPDSEVNALYDELTSSINASFDEQQVINHLENRLATRNQVVDLKLVHRAVMNAAYSSTELTSLLIKKQLLSQKVTRSKQKQQRQQHQRQNKQLRDLHTENMALLEEVSAKMASLNEVYGQINEDIAENQTINELKDELKTAKVRGDVLAEFITALVSSSGINWAESDFLRQTLLYCGEMYRDEEISDSDEDD